MALVEEEAPKANSNRLKIYSQEEIDHYERSKYLKKYVIAGRTRAINSGIAYQNRLNRFSQFIYQKMDKREVDDVITNLQSGKQILIYDGKSEPESSDVYDMFNALLQFLREREKPTKLSANVINATIRTTKKFLKFSKVRVDSEDFADRVQLLRKETPTKNPIEKGDVVKLLNACKNIRLKTAVHLLAGTGPRPIEACALRNMDVDLDSDRPTVTFRAEYSKMRVARTRRLTREVANQLRLWKDWKYRERRTSVKQKDGTFDHEIVKPKPKPDELFLAHAHFGDKETTPEGLYTSLQTEFAQLFDMVYARKDRTSANGNARNITLKTFRDFVKTTLADTISTDYSEYQIGHAKSTYYEKTPAELEKTFQKAERYLTYLDISALVAHGQAVENKIQEDRRVIESMQQQMARMEEEHKRDMEELRAMLAQEPKLANVKPEELLKARRKHQS